AEPARAYLREVGGRMAVKDVYGPFIPTSYWQVRFTRPLVADEYRVQLLPDAADSAGGFAVTAQLSETTPGARLSDAAARELAQGYLATRPGWAGVGATGSAASTPERSGGR